MYKRVKLHNKSTFKEIKKSKYRYLAVLYGKSETHRNE